MDPTTLHAFHTFVVGPAFVYIGLGKTTIPNVVFTILGIVGVVIFLYHSYLAYTKLRDGKSAWINWIHVFIIAPLLLLLAKLRQDASRRYFEMLMMLGFASIGYHGMYLARETIFSA